MATPDLNIYRTAYDDEVYTDTNTLYKHRLITPVQLSATLTHLYGKTSDMMAPLLMLTEGNEAISRLEKKAMNDTQFTWPVIGRMKNVNMCMGLVNTTNDNPGRGGTVFDVYFKDKSFHNYQTIYSPNKQYQARIQGEGRKVSAGKYKYTAKFITSLDTEYLPVSQVQSGLYWVAGPPTIPDKRSQGTASNRMVPGSMKNQWGLHRFSMNIAGNIANKVTVIEFPAKGGGTTNLWMPYEMDQWEQTRRLQKEHWLWYSNYNRNTQGEITTIDDATGEPVPYTSGLKEQIVATGNHSTYTDLTVTKLNNTVHSIFSNRVDKTPMELVLYTGTAGAIAFDEALKADSRGYSYYTPLGEKEIRSGTDGYLSYGSYFNQYKTYEGHTLTVKVVPFFNQGLFAELDRANGNLAGPFPADSKTMVFVDHSMTDNGERNIQLVVEKGREHKSMIYAGMSDLPAGWGAINETKFAGTKEDVASYEVIDTAGLAIKNATTSFWLDWEG